MPNETEQKPEGNGFDISYGKMKMAGRGPLSLSFLLIIVFATGLGFLGYIGLRIARSNETGFNRIVIAQEEFKKDSARAWEQFSNVHDQQNDSILCLAWMLGDEKSRRYMIPPKCIGKVPNPFIR